VAHLLATRVSSMPELFPSIAQCAIVATALKVLLFPA